VQDIGTEVLTLQIPQATVHSSLVAEAWLAWHSIPRRRRRKKSIRTTREQEKRRKKEKRERKKERKKERNLEK